MYECLCSKKALESQTPVPLSNNILSQYLLASSNDTTYTITPENPDKPIKIDNFSYYPSSFTSTYYQNISYPFLMISSYILKKQSSNTNLSILHIQNIHLQTPPKYTLLYSHGNTVSLGTVFPTLLDLSASLKCNVISYDYSGYNNNTVIANESEINDDITNVISFCTKILNIHLRNIILFGDSFGTTPTIYISSKDKYQELAGVLLLSPASSGSYFTYMNKLKNENKAKRRKQNAVHNESTINNIACPVFLIHGYKDSVIPVLQSLDISEELKHSGKSYCWFPKKGTHDNVISELRRKFYRKFIYFVDLIERFQHSNDVIYKNNSDLNMRPTINIGNISVGKQREENFMSFNDGRPTGNNMVIPNPISSPENKVFESSGYTGNDSSNFIVMNDTGRVTNTGIGS